MRRRARYGAAALALVWAAGCGQILGLDDPKDRPDGSVGPDGAPGADGSNGPSDANVGADGASPGDASNAGDGNTNMPDTGSTDAGMDAPTATFTTLSEPTNWDKFDVTTVDPNAYGWNVAVFDGRNMIFGSAGQRFLAQYDTTGAYTNTASWTVSNIANVSGELFNFNSAAFDGRYMYLSAAHYSSARYDTTGSAADAGSWTLSGQFVASAGMGFDGRYLYEVPNYSGVFLSSVERYDTKSDAGFGPATAWSTYDTTNNGSNNAAGFGGAAFDGKYMYFAPAAYTVSVRYDTTSNFTSVGSWTDYDLATAVDTTGSQYFGAVFDGRYVYYVPSGVNNHRAIVTRYDTTLPFNAPTSYATFDLQTLDNFAAGFRGGVFDGRYVYFVPNISVPGFAGSHVTRFDTTSAFTVGTSWEIYDTTNVDGASKNFCGGAFDGAYVYFLPCSSGLITRFKAKSPASIPNVPPKLTKGIASFQ